MSSVLDKFCWCAGARWTSLILTTLLVLVVWGDVLFFEASLHPASYSAVLGNPDLPVDEVRYLGNPLLRGYFRDVGASAWQMAPMVEYWRYFFSDIQSPYWNPFQAAGELGPESLVDTKFSFLAILSGLLGGGMTAFSIIHVVFFFLSGYCLTYTLIHFFKVRNAAAFTGCAVFYLSGFSAANTFSQMGHPYYYAPILICSLFYLLERPGVKSFTICVFAHVPFLTLTFLPSLVLTGFFCHGLIAVYSCSFNKSRARYPWSNILCQIGCGLVAVMILAPLYFPIIESFFLVDLWEHYNSRFIQPLPLKDSISWITPIFRLYLDSTFNDRSFHLGLVVLLVAILGLFWRDRLMVVFLSSCILLPFLRLFFTPVSDLVSFIPVFRFISLEYWGQLPALGCIFLAAFGVHKLESVSTRMRFSVCVVAFFLLIISCFNAHGGIPFQIYSALYPVHLIVLVILSGMAIVIIKWNPAFMNRSGFLIAIAAFLELFSYHAGVMVKRQDRFQDLPPAFEKIRSELATPADFRVLNIGRGSMHPNWAQALRIPDLGTMNSGSTVFPWYRHFFQEYIGHEWGFLALGRDVSSKPFFTVDVLKLAGVRYVIVDNDLTNSIAHVESLGLRRVDSDQIRSVFEVDGYFPRCFIVNNIINSDKLPHEHGFSGRRVATTENESLMQRYGKDFDSSFFNSAQGLPENPLASAVAAITRYDNTHVTIEGFAAEPGVLVMMDAYHPNWRAIVNGVDADVVRMNTAFRGVAVETGKFTVEMIYAPKTLAISLVLSGFAVLSLVGMLAWSSTRLQSR